MKNDKGCVSDGEVDTVGLHMPHLR